jgi:hypothetical protein
MKWNKSALVVVIFIASGCQSQSPIHSTPGKAWFAKARFGLFFHYLPSGPDFNDKVNSFNVERFADQVAQTKADYVIFTLGQDSGYQCSPNAAYDRITGYKPGQRTSRRDLPMEIADALARRHIHLILYSTCRSPNDDEGIMAAFSDVPSRQKAPQEFIRRWSEVVEEWSRRYGRKISGWWIDGVYRPESYDLSLPYNWNTWSAAYRAGNPDALLAYNNGSAADVAFIKFTDHQDYTAGEQNRFGPTPESYPPYPTVHWHILSYLGDRWASPTGPDYTNDWLIDYVKKVNRQGGTVSIDANIAWDGTIYPPHFRLLTALGNSLHK